MRIDLFNSKNPNGLRIPVNVSIDHSDLVSSNDGELLWLIVLAPRALDLNGNQINDVILTAASEEDVKHQIGKGLAIIAEQIDWGTLKEDTKAPRIDSIYPEPRSTSVPISSFVNLKLRDEFPSSGIVPGSIKLTVNGIDVTAEAKIKLDVNEAKIRWIPKVKT